MILIVGGCASGKLTFAQTLGFDPALIADASLDDKPAIRHVERLVSEGSPGIEELIEALSAKELVLVGEIGCGPVPSSERQAQVRELVGRLTAELAARASKVYRMVCGIPCVIKE